jgi:hypothetical protein
MTSIDRVFEPRPAAQRVYDGVFDAYVGLYPALAPVLWRNASLAEVPAGAAA